MRRNLAKILIGGVLGLISLGCLANIRAGGGDKQLGPRTNGWRLLEPVSYENITLFPVVSGHTAETAAFVTLDEGLSSGEVVVSELGADGLYRSRDGQPTAIPAQGAGASVNRLALIHRGKRPLVLLAGELVSGGKQDRIIAKDRIVAPGADPLPLDVFCVEHGRWSSGAVFSSAKIMVHPSVREKAAVDQKQTDIWAAVRAGTTAGASARDLAAAPPTLNTDTLGRVVASEAQTEAYGKIYQSRVVSVPLEGFVEEIEKRFSKATANLKGERVVGVVVVAYGGEVAWSDIFASSELFAKYWSKLLRSYAVEALARPQLREHASLEDAREFLRPLQGMERAESEPGVYRWREVTAGHMAEIELEALQPTDLVLHQLKIHRTN